MLAAARAVTAREVPLLVVLMAIRRLPAAVRRRRLSSVRRALDEPLMSQFTRGGFVVLAERPDELVVGAVGRFWSADAASSGCGPRNSSHSPRQVSQRPR